MDFCVSTITFVNAFVIGNNYLKTCNEHKIAVLKVDGC